MQGLFHFWNFRSLFLKLKHTQRAYLLRERQLHWRYFLNRTLDTCTTRNLNKLLFLVKGSFSLSNLFLISWHDFSFRFIKSNIVETMAPIYKNSKMKCLISRRKQLSCDHMRLLNFKYSHGIYVHLKKMSAVKIACTKNLSD